MRRKLFVVEDDADIARLLSHHLQAAGFEVREFSSASGVLEAAEGEPPALILLDVMLPEGDGFQLGRSIRQNPKLGPVPMIFVTAKTSEPDRVRGLDLGADDYVTKPFGPRELVARVRAVLRRFETPLAPAVRRLGEIEIDAGAMELRVRGKRVTTTATEFRLIDYLASRPGRVLTRDNILDGVWRDTSFVTPRSVDVYMRRLREKIERDPEAPQYLKTVRGAGYKFEAPS